MVNAIKILTCLLYTSSVLASYILVGCATFSQDGGLAGVKKTTEQHIKQELVWPKTEAEQKITADRVSELLKTPMDADCAVQIALLNNKGLQASFYELGISEADVVQAGRLPNPKFTMLYARNNGDYKIEQALTFNIFSLITMPKMLAIERGNFEKTKHAVALNAVSYTHLSLASFSLLLKVLSCKNADKNFTVGSNSRALRSVITV